MTKIINSWNEWDPLKHIIMGRPAGTNITALETGWMHDLPDGGYPLGTWGPFPEEMIEEAARQMDVFQQLLEKRGIKVDRITVEPFMLSGEAVSTPDWTQLNCHGVNNVRDVTLVHGNMVIESTTTRRSRWYEYLNLRNFWEKWFKEDPEMLWIAAPKPRLTDKSYVKNYDYYFNNVWSDAEKQEKTRKGEYHLTEHEPLWDAADIFRFGKDVIHNNSSVSNKSGIDWLKRQYATMGLRVHMINCENIYHPWHIDGNFCVLGPGRCVYNPEWLPITPEFWELFKINDWEMIPAALPEAINLNKCTILGDYNQTSWVSMNTLSINPSTICVEQREKAYCDQLDSLGLEVLPIAYDRVIPLGGALHCTTLDIYREGSCEDYFPRQIPGY